MKMQIEESDVQEVLSSYFGLGLSKEQAQSFLERNADVCAAIAHFGVFDTESRSVIIDALCKELGVGKCPIFKDGKAVYTQFKTKLALAAEFKGYSFNSKEE